MEYDGQRLSGLKGTEPEAAQALHELFLAYAQQLIHFARRFSLDRESAEDVVQNVFLALWSNRLSSSIGVDLKAYLYAAVRNQSLNHLRHSKTVRDSEQELKLIVPDPPGDVDRVEYEQLRQTIQRAVDSLPDQCKNIFLMSRLDGLTYKQIAAALEISVKTVETHMGRALKHIRSLISVVIVILAASEICRFFL